MLDLLLLFHLILFAVIAFVLGVIATLAVQWYCFNLYIDSKPFVGPTKPVVSPFELPKGLLDEGSLGKEPAGALNAMLQFLFQECRNTKRVRRWFRHKLSLELEELLTRTTTGKLFEKIILRDLNMGSHFPAIRSIEVKTLSVDSGTKLIDEVELCLDLEYSGQFQLSIDASMRLSKAAHVSVKVNELSGLARLKFTRNPYTHWNFSFYSDPHLQLSVESQFQGRSLPQVNSIIASQIRKALKKKHTLPFFKIRYKPFFMKTEFDLLEDSEINEPPAGVLELTVIEATRVNECEGPIYCNAAIDETAWIEMTQSGTANYLTVDVTISKQSGHNIGIVFKQEFVPDKYQVCVVVDSISNPVVNDLKVGDIVALVDGKTVQSLSSLNRLVKQSSSKLTLRVERRMKSFGADKATEAVEPFGLRNRVSGSGDKLDDSDSSNPPSSNDSPAKRSASGSPEHARHPPRWSLGSEAESDLNSSLLPQVLTTKDVPYSKVITFNESFKIQVTPEHKYLNLSLWNRGQERNTLLGHLSIPVASRCCPPSVGHYISLFSLLPPNPSSANTLSNSLSSHPGFEPCLCFGDVLLSFSFKPDPATRLGPTQTSTTSSTNPPVTITMTPSQNSTQSDMSPMTTGGGSEHDFVRTHFEKVTQCGFCFKKIWLKDAFRCSGCMMSCHKKCAVKAQTGVGCARSARRQSVQPEIITTAAENGGSQSGRTLSTLIASVASRGIKRAGSATNLAPPGIDGYLGGSISLPPSPHHSPSPSRKASLVEEGLFSTSSSNGDEINQALEILLSRPHDDDVMDAAKASGKSLFADLPPEIRKSKIDDMISKLKDAMDAETRNHQVLQKEEMSLDNATAKAKVAFLVGKSEEKLQALTVLMLHCCAGLQDYQESAS